MTDQVVLTFGATVAASDGRIVATPTGGSLRSSLGRNLTHSLLDVVGRAIVTGRYEKIAFPAEAELARQYGVSLTVTREAVKMLTAKGLVSARRAQRTIVQPAANWSLFDADVLRWLLARPFSVELFTPLGELRAAIEPEAAALAAERGTVDQFQQISAGLARIAEAERGRDDMLSSDIAFHVAVLQASNNPFYVQFRNVVEAALRTSSRCTTRILGRTPSLVEHEAVAEAILARNAPRARSAMRKMIYDVLNLVHRAGPRLDLSGPTMASKTP